MNNKELIEKYPFLQLRNVWTGKLIEDCDYTYLDHMPKGWRNCFGIQMCDDILKALIEGGMNPRDYFITQIKEKYGGLCWYDNGAPEQVSEVIMKYEYLSEHVCINCGKVNVPIYGGWVSPYCDDCAKEIYKNPEECIIEPADLKSYFKVERHDKNGKTTRKVDISDILKRIGYNVSKLKE